MKYQRIKFPALNARLWFARLSVPGVLSCVIFLLFPAAGSMQLKPDFFENTLISAGPGVFTQDSNPKIAFSTIRNGPNEIFTMNPDGSNQINLTNTPLAGDDHPSWSPDGSKIAYVSASGGNFDIYTMNVDGSNKTRLTTDSGDDELPGWSPDGTKIIFNSKRTGAGDIYIMNADGSNQTRLTTDNASNAAAKFSPDGTKIVFNNSSDGDHEVYLMSSDGTNKIKLTNNTAFDGVAVFSPDGSKIAFHSGRIGGLNIFVMDAGGGNQINITNTGTDWLPSWSADGTKIVFASTRHTSNGEIYMMNSDGTNQTRLTNNSLADYFPAWQHLSGDITVSPAANLKVTFASVSQSGYTVAAPLTAGGLPAFPNGYMQANGTTAYDIHTSAQFTGNAKIQFNVPNVASASICDNLSILHYVNGAWQSGGNFAPVYNSGTQICTVAQSTETLSPFAVALKLAPTAASVSIGGRVLTTDGRGIKNAVISLTDENSTRTAVSNAFGRYNFEDVTAGETIIVQVTAKRFTFSQPVRVFMAQDNLSEVDFVADDYSMPGK